MDRDTPYSVSYSCFPNSTPWPCDCSNCYLIQENLDPPDSGRCFPLVQWSTSRHHHNHPNLAAGIEWQCIRSQTSRVCGTRWPNRIAPHRYSWSPVGYYPESRVIHVLGTPASGKSTLARLLHGHVRRVFLASRIWWYHSRVCKYYSRNKLTFKLSEDVKDYVIWELTNGQPAAVRAVLDGLNSSKVNHTSSQGNARIANQIL